MGLAAGPFSEDGVCRRGSCDVLSASDAITRAGANAIFWTSARCDDWAACFGGCASSSVIEGTGACLTDGAGCCSITAGGDEAPDVDCDGCDASVLGLGDAAIDDVGA